MYIVFDRIKQLINKNKNFNVSLLKYLFYATIVGFIEFNTVPRKVIANDCPNSIPLSNFNNSFIVKVHTKDSNLPISPGSGVIIKVDNTSSEKRYILVTNNHVITGGKLFTIETIDKKLYPAKLLKNFDNPDLALLEFTANSNYSVGKLVPDFSLGRLTNSSCIFAIGYPITIDTIKTISGRITLLLPRYIGKGFQIGFNAETEKGMSGGAILNSNGEVIGITGRGIFPNNGFGSKYEDYFKTEAGINISSDAFPKELIINSSWAIPIEVLVGSTDIYLTKELLVWDERILTPTATKNILPPVTNQSSVSLRTELPNSNENFNNQPQIKVDQVDDVNGKKYSVQIFLNDTLMLSSTFDPGGTFQKYFVKDINQDGYQDIILHFIPLEQDKENQVKVYLYFYDQASNTYTSKEPLLLHSNYSWDDLDNDGSLEIRSLILDFVNEFGTDKDIRNFQKLLPENIFKFKDIDDNVTDVTQELSYIQIHRQKAQKLFQRYNEYLSNFRKKPNSTKLNEQEVLEFQIIVSAYTLNKYLAKEPITLNDIKQLYPFSGQDNFVEKINKLLNKLGLL